MKKSLNPIIEIDGTRYQRIPVKTKILQPNDDFVEIIREFALPQMQAGDMLVISESPLAITQNRAIPVKDIKIGLHRDRKSVV